MSMAGMEAVRAVVPSIAELARGLGITRGAVSQWKRVPAERVGQVSQLTGISPNILRPDLFPFVDEAPQ